MNQEDEAIVGNIIKAIDTLQESRNQMVNIINDMNSRINLLTQIIGSQIKPIAPGVEVTNAEIIAFMEKEGVSWEESKRVLTEWKEKKNEGTEETLHIPV